MLDRADQKKPGQDAYLRLEELMAAVTGCSKEAAEALDQGRLKPKAAKRPR